MPSVKKKTKPAQKVYGSGLITMINRRIKRKSAVKNPFCPNPDARGVKKATSRKPALAPPVKKATNRPTPKRGPKTIQKAVSSKAKPSSVSKTSKAVSLNRKRKASDSKVDTAPKAKQPSPQKTPNIKAVVQAKNRALAAKKSPIKKMPAKTRNQVPIAKKQETPKKSRGPEKKYDPKQVSRAERMRKRSETQESPKKLTQNANKKNLQKVNERKVKEAQKEKQEKVSQKEKQEKVFQKEKHEKVVHKEKQEKAVQKEKQEPSDNKEKVLKSSEALPKDEKKDTSSDQNQQPTAAKDPSCSTIICLDCGSPFYDRKSLALHKRTDCKSIFPSAKSNKVPASEASKVVMCGQCGVNFASKQLFLSHREKCEAGAKRDVKLHKCNYCSPTVWFPGFSAFLEHMKSSHTMKAGQNLFMCNKCGTMFLSTEDLKQHGNADCASDPLVSFDTKNLELKCSKCKNAFGSSTELQNHIQKCKSGFLGSVRCSYCTKKVYFQTSRELENHKKAKHQGQNLNLFICGHCGKRFDYVKELNEHVETNHDSSKDKRVEVPLSEIMQKIKELPRRGSRERGFGSNARAATPFITELNASNGDQNFAIKIDTRSGQPQVVVNVQKDIDVKCIQATSSPPKLSVSSEGQKSKDKAVIGRLNLLTAQPVDKQLAKSKITTTPLKTATPSLKSKTVVNQAKNTVPQMKANTTPVKTRGVAAASPLKVKVNAPLKRKENPQTPNQQTSKQGNIKAAQKRKAEEVYDQLDDEVPVKTKMLQAKAPSGRTVLVPIAITQGIHVKSCGGESVMCTECKLKLDSMSQVASHACARCIKCMQVMTSVAQVAKHVCAAFK